MDHRIERVIALMDADPRRVPSLTEAARAINLSASRLRHLFKDEVGVSHARYLRRLKKNRAIELLEATFMSIKEVVHLVGAGDISHFTRDFKRDCGLTPTQYRACSAVALTLNADVLEAGSHFRQ